MYNYCILLEGLNTYLSLQLLPFILTQNLEWHHFTARLLNYTFTNKIDHFKNDDEDRETEFESIFTVQWHPNSQHNIEAIK